MFSDPYPVRWAGQLAIVALPAHIGLPNAGQVGEELLSVINHGAAELIADMTATVSCDHAGTDAVLRAYQRAVASGTELRLAVTAPVVRRVLSLSGLDHLVSIYPSLEAATAPVWAGQARRGEELLDSVLASMFHIGLSLQAAAELPPDAAGPRIAEALQDLDDVIREIRDAKFAGQVGSGTISTEPEGDWDMQMPQPG